MVMLTAAYSGTHSGVNRILFVVCTPIGGQGGALHCSQKRLGVPLNNNTTTDGTRSVL